MCIKISALSPLVGLGACDRRPADCQLFPINLDQLDRGYGERKEGV